MEEINSKRVVFSLPEDTDVVYVIDDILKNNGLEENDEKYLRKSKGGDETHLTIVRDAAITIFQKKIPEKKLVELLAKHLETSREVAGKIVLEIKQKLIPFAKIISDEPPQEKTLEVESPQPSKPLPYGKKVEITNVEENAKTLQKARTVISQEVNEKSKEGYKEPDPYKESLE